MTQPYGFDFYQSTPKRSLLLKFTLEPRSVNIARQSSGQVLAERSAGTGGQGPSVASRAARKLLLHWRAGQTPEQTCWAT